MKYGRETTYLLTRMHVVLFSDKMRPNYIVEFDRQ